MQPFTINGGDTSKWVVYAGPFFRPSSEGLDLFQTNAITKISNTQDSEIKDLTIFKYLR